MIAWLSFKLFILNVLGFIQVHWRIVLGVIVGLLAVFLIFKACGSSPTPKLDQKAIIEAQKAIEEKNDAKLKEILVESDVKVQQIDANVAEGRKELVNAQYEAKKKYEGLTCDQLAEEIERRMGQ